MNRTSELLKQAAKIILAQQEKLAQLSNEQKNFEQDSEKMKLVNEIIKLKKQKEPNLTEAEIETKRKELLNRDQNFLKSFLQGLKESSIHHENLGKVAHQISQEIDEWDAILMR